MKGTQVMYEWEDYFEPHILERGWRYAKSGAVQHITRKKDVIEAVVEGSEYYKVKINYDGHYVLNAYCSCPYAADGNYSKLTTMEKTTMSSARPTMKKLFQMVIRRSLSTN